jgi:succinate dehydrogenase hydrophobic anchor subunit
VTGKCTGTAPWSGVKVTALILAIFAIAMIAIWIAGNS